MAGKTKTASDLRRHLKRRAAERYGVFLNEAAIRQIVEKIQNQKAKFLERQSCVRTKWLIELDGRPAVVVYDSKRHTTVTVLPPECARNLESAN